MADSQCPQRPVRPFRFKQFEIAQKLSPMKVGTDGVLLGAYATLPATTLPSDTPLILDIGCGTGLIALMLAQRYPNAKITAIDAHAGAAQEAVTNALRSPFSKRITIYHATLQAFDSPSRFDLIVSNPPYYTEETKSPRASRNLAKHTDSLTPGELFRSSAGLLAPHGALTMILPVNGFIHYATAAKQSGLQLSAVLLICPKPNTPPKRIIATWHPETQNSPQSTTISYLIIEKARHLYTDDYIALTAPFYLNMY